MTFAQVLTVHSGLAGAPYLTTLRFNAVGGLTPGGYRDLVASFWTDLAAGIRNSNIATVSGVIGFYDEETGEQVSEDITSNISVNGSDASTPEWTAKQGLIAWRTPAFLDGRRYTGRTFIPGVASGSGEQVPGAPYIARANTAAANLRDDAASAGSPLVVWRRPSPARTGSNPRPARPGSMAEVTSGLCRSYWAVLRSRRD